MAGRVKSSPNSGASVPRRHQDEELEGGVIAPGVAGGA